MARIAPDGMQDENNREISGHQARIHDKRLVRVWPEWGVLEPKETAGTQVYFSAEVCKDQFNFIVLSKCHQGQLRLVYLSMEWLICSYREKLQHTWKSWWKEIPKV